MATPEFLITDASKTYTNYWELKDQGIVLDKNPGPLVLSLCSLNPEIELGDYFLDTSKTTGLVNYTIIPIDNNQLEFNWGFVENVNSSSLPPYFTEYTPTEVIEYYQDSVSIYCTFRENNKIHESNTIRLTLTLEVHHLREGVDPEEINLGKIFSLMSFNLVPELLEGQWRKIRSINNSNLAIRGDGTLWSWGDNSYGRLGLGDSYDHSSPTQVGSLTSWTDIYSDETFNLATQSTGSLWGWGNNSSGQLGLGDTYDRSSPCQIRL